MTERYHHSPMNDFVKAEGIPPAVLPPPISEEMNHLMNVSEELFRFVLPQEDERWSIAQAFAQIDKNKTRGVHIECALRATYLSSIPSYRNGFCSYYSEPNIRHLCRAITNLAAHDYFTDRFPMAQAALAPGMALELDRTNRILMGSNSQGITGCPEALYQLRLWWQGKYVGRIGFNSHFEDWYRVISITNIQGIPNGQTLYRQLEAEHGVRPFNFLVQRLIDMCGNEPRTIFRGWSNPKKGDPRLYNPIFRTEKIDRFSFHKTGRDQD